MDYTDLFLPAFVLLIGGRFLYGRLKYGSWTGSFLKGKIESTSGEVEVARAMGTTQKLTVYTMRNEGTGETFVGLVISAKAAFGASMAPYKLSKSQSTELAAYLTRAAS